MSKLVSVIVLNYNGLSILKKFFPSVVDSTNYNNPQNEIIVVDNNSSDGSVAYLEKEFPFVNVLKLKENKVMAGLNEGVKMAKNDIVVLLNNDIKTKIDFLDGLINPFNDNEVFAVSPSFNWNEENSSSQYIEIPKYEFIFGFFRPVGRVDYSEKEIKTKKRTGILATGAGAFDKKKFLEIGGFDEIYLPAYFEDIALCYEARKRGWKVLLEPKSLTYHEAHSTMNSLFKKQKIIWMQNKNRFIFLWTYITDFKLLLSHILTIPIILLLGLFSRGPAFFLSFFSALIKLPQIIKRRREKKKKFSLTDKKICRDANISIRYLNLKVLKSLMYRIFKKK